MVERAVAAPGDHPLAGCASFGPSHRLAVAETYFDTVTRAGGERPRAPRAQLTVEELLLDTEGAGQCGSHPAVCVTQTRVEYLQRCRGDVPTKIAIRMIDGPCKPYVGLYVVSRIFGAEKPCGGTRDRRNYRSDNRPSVVRASSAEWCITHSLVQCGWQEHGRGDDTPSCRPPRSPRLGYPPRTRHDTRHKSRWRIRAWPIAA